MRLLIYLGLGYLAYRAVKNWMAPAKTSRQSVSSDSVGEIDGVMVKDPVCGVYFPKEEGIRHQHDGEDLLFCSQECKSEFIRQHQAS